MEDAMSSLTRTMLPAFALAAMMSVAQAQTANDQDHNAHHPAGQGAAQTQVAPTAPVPSPQGTAPGPMPGPMGSGGMPMMGQGQQQGGQPGMMMGMDRMRSMMGQQGAQAGSGPAMSCSMMSRHADVGSPAGMGMPFEHVEGRIAFLKAELKITDAQTAPWNAYADALRANARAHQAVHELKSKAGAPSGWIQRLDVQEKMLATRAEALRALRASAGPLFTSLSEEQRALADRLLTGPMGMM
jgi:hypothetical protein